MAQRLEPTVSDVNLALIDVGMHINYLCCNYNIGVCVCVCVCYTGSKYNSLDSYSKRFPRRHLPRR